MSRFFDRRLLRQALGDPSTAPGKGRPAPLRMLLTGSGLGLALTVALGALGGLATVGQAFTLSRAVDGAFLGGLGLAGIWPWLCALAGLTGLRAAAAWAGEIAACRVAVQVKSALRAKLMAHVAALGPAFIQNERTGELVNTAVEGVEALDAYFSQYLPQVALAAIVPIICLALVFPADLLSGFVLLLTAPLIPLFMILIGNLADALTHRQWTELSRMSAHFLDVLQGLTTLKLFNRSREQIEIIRQITDQHRDATLQVLRVAFLSALVLEMVGTLSTAIVAVEIGLRLLYGKMAFQQAFFVLILAPEFYLPLRLLGTRFHAGIAGVTAARRIFEVLETGGSGCETDKRMEGGAEGLPHICFEDVGFAYGGRDFPALDGVSFEIRPGEKVALVGATGAGKSTVAALLLGFITPTRGRIRNGERDPREGGGAGATDAKRINGLRTEEQGSEGGHVGPPLRVAWVPQAPYLFDASVADNIRLGRPGAGPDAVMRAAAAAAADTFIRALPQGYETRIGERGSRLSAGQAQRIALARAFLVGCPLVILDEATAHLDAGTEAAVQASIERLLQGRSALVIAHRLNTIRRADRIIVLEEGRVAEAGTHEELLARRGAYWRLVEAGQSGGAGGLEHEAAKDREAHEARRHEDVGDKSPISHASFHALRTTHYPQGAYGSAPISAFHLFRRLLSFLTPFWPWVALSVLLGFVTIGSSIGLLATSAWIIATAALQPSVAVLQVAIVGVRFFGILRGVARYLERLVSHQVTFRVLARLRAWFYAAIEPLAPARLAGYHSGDLLSRIVADIGALENFFIRAVAPPLVAVLVTALISLVLGSVTHDGRVVWPVLTLLLLTGAGAPALVVALSRNPGRQLAERRANLNAMLVDGIQGAADLRAFAAVEGHVRGLRDVSDALGRSQVRMAAISGLSGALGILFTWLAVIAVLVVAAPLVAAGRLPGVSLAVLALATSASFEGVLPLPLAAQHLESSLAAARRLFEIAGATDAKRINGWGSWNTTPLNYRRGAQARSDAKSATPQTPPTARGAGEREEHEGERGSGGAPLLGGFALVEWESPTSGGLRAGRVGAPRVRFEGVTMRYAEGEEAALDDVTLEAPAGSTVAIVGPSGAGKTSLANALLRFWDYEGGAIWLGGRELRDIEGTAVRQQIGVVAHDVHLFNATVRDNLLLGRPDASQEQLEAAARAAGVHDFIASLPDGYDTWIGEGGAALSGGERQRLAIARALVKDAPVLILDEPTANLDALTEQRVSEALAELLSARRRTALVITHRPSLTRAADQIVVMDGGRVIDAGSHDELVARCALYGELISGL